MSQANFTDLPPAGDGAGPSRSLSIFADRPHLRAEIREDAEAAGFRIDEVAEVGSLLAGEEARPLGDLVVIDCPVVDGGILAALSRIDLRAAHSGAQLVVSTTVTALDDVFACLDQSRPQILVEPSRAERVMALGRALGELSNVRVRELVEEDRLVLLRLTEQIGRLAERLEGLPTREAGAAPDPTRLASPRPGFTAAGSDGSGRLVSGKRPPWPDPRFVRRVIRQRQLRGRLFAGDLFADAAWDILLDLTAARGEGKRVSVTSLCIASGVPPTTALRWIGHMTELGLLQRIDDMADRRRAFIVLTDKAEEGMARYFAELGGEAALAA